MTLDQLKIGQSAVISAVGGEGELRQHFLDMGVIPEAEVTLVKLAPMGDPMEIRLHGYELTLRLSDASKIEVSSVREASVKQAEEVNAWMKKAPRVSEEKNTSDKVHPGIGECKKNEKEGEGLLKDGEPLTFALAGNQNCGKTTLFNQLTGANQHVGNFPGVTVDRKSGIIKGKPDTIVTDLPGIYSLSPYSSEEIVSRQFILNEKPRGIINIVDATNIERNLYLTMQLMELDVPMVLALNMMDEVRGNGGSVYINAMEQALGIPVIPISAAKNEGIGELVDHALHVAKYRETPGKQDFCDASDHGGAVHRALHAVMHLIEKRAKDADIPIRFAATKLIEGDPQVQEALHLSEAEKNTMEQIVSQMEQERGLDRAAAIADMRFSFIQRLVQQCVVKPRESKESRRSKAIDQVLTGKYTAVPAFIVIMALVFWLTFNVIGAFLQGLLEQGIDALSGWISAGMQAMEVNATLQSLVVDGILNGVGSVVSFLPIIVILFFFLSLLEDTGYMARIAFVMDQPLRKIGLSGRSIVPMLIGFGCSVPAVMSSRTLPSERDRKLTVLMIPFMSCTAKLPIYGFFISVFFPKYSGLIMVLLYLTGIFVGIITTMIFRKTVFEGEAVPFVMELPNYRLPGMKNVAQLLWEKAKDFLQRAFTIILLATIAVWFLQTFDLGLNIVTDSKNSILAMVAGVIAPIFKPLGFGDWRISTALISGFMAKESVVSSLTILFGTTEAFNGFMSPAGAAALLVFCLLYTPCIAAIASIKRELGTRWAVGTVLLQCGVAWICAFIIHGIGLVFI
jgi:ferrous iron transport protein B